MDGTEDVQQLTEPVPLKLGQPTSPEIFPFLPLHLSNETNVILAASHQACALHQFIFTLDRQYVSPSTPITCVPAPLAQVADNAGVDITKTSTDKIIKLFFIFFSFLLLFIRAINRTRRWAGQG